MRRANLPEGWERIRLDAVLSEHQDRVENRALDALSLTKDLGVIQARDRFGRALHGRDVSKYRHVRSGEVVVDPMLLWDGAIARLWRHAEGFVSPDYRVYRLNPRIDPRFFDFLVESHHMRAAFKNNARGTNKRRNRIARSDFLGIEFASPPLGEQERIAAILSSFDDAIGASEAILEQARLVKQGLLDALVSRGIGHREFKQTELGELPAAWRVVRLGEVASVFNGRGARSGGSTVRLFKTKHIYDGPVRMSEPEYQPDELLSSIPDSAYLRAGDVLTPNMAHSTIGRVSWLQATPGKALCDGQVMVIRTRDEQVVRARYIFDFLTSRIGRRQLLAREVGSVFGPARGQTHLYPRDVSTIALPLPSPEEQDEIGRSVWLDREVTQQDSWIRQATQVRTGVLEDLICGRVRVS